MKICLINNLYFPFSRGGAERVVETIANSLAQEEHEVVVITSRSPGRKIEEKRNKIKIIRFFPVNLFWIGEIEKYPFFLRLFWHFFDIFNFYSYFQIKKILKRIKPDLIITHNLKGMGYLIPRAVFSLGIKHFHTLHDVQLAVPSGLLIKGEENDWKNIGWPARLYQKINKKLFSYPEVIISPSRWLLDFYKNKGFFKNQKTKIIPNPFSQIADPVFFAKQQSRPFQPVQKSDSRFKFLYVGQLEKHKGIVFLLKVFKKVPQDFCFFIAGDGREKQTVLKFSEKDKRIKYLGKLSQEEVFRQYKQADLTVVPSLCWENSPSVIYESFMAGTPVLASRLGGILEIVNEGENGFLFKAGSPEDLFQKIEFCLANKNKVLAMKEKVNSRKISLSLKEYIEKILKLNKKADFL